MKRTIRSDQIKLDHITSHQIRTDQAFACLSRINSDLNKTLKKTTSDMQYSHIIVKNCLLYPAHLPLTSPRHAPKQYKMYVALLNFTEQHEIDIDMKLIAIFKKCSLKLTAT